MASTDAPALIARSKTLINADLKKICKEERRAQSGNKAQLQQRVIDLIHDAVARNDSAAIQRLRYRIHNHGDAPPPAHSPANGGFSDPYSSPGAPLASMQNGYAGHSAYSSQPQTSLALRIFKPSPFYDYVDLLLKDIVLDASPSHKQVITRTLMIPADISARMKQDPSLRLLLFANVDQPLSAYSLHDVTFPSQLEVRVNNDEVRANFKGLKNKPGSTRPADITDYVRKTPPNYRNQLQITYALTQRKYMFYVYLAKKHSVEELVKRITKVITKQSVLDEMRLKAQDPDIEVGSINMGLKDPVSTLRITTPCRSMVCNHMQCFDAESFLQLQEQAPTWQCPICSKTVSFEALAVDQYVQEILKAVPKGTDQVTIDPHGTWSYGNGTQTQTPRTNGYSGSHASHADSDDDLIDVTDHRISAIKTEAAPTPQSLARTPLSSTSREASSAPRTGSKRKSEVIDLTLSDDEEPVRPTKKVAYNPAPSSISDGSRRYQEAAYGSIPVPMRPLPPSHPSMSPSLSSVMRSDSHQTPPLQTRPDGTSYAYRLPPPRPSYPGRGSSAYLNSPTYIDSSP